MLVKELNGIFVYCWWEYKLVLLLYKIMLRFFKILKIYFII